MTAGEIALLMRIDANERPPVPDGKPRWQCPRCSAPFNNSANFGMHKRACTKQPASESKATNESEQFRARAGVCLSAFGKADSVKADLA